MPHTFPLAFSTLGCPGWTLEQAAAFAEAQGYVALELRLLDADLIPADLPQAGRRRIVDALRRHGLSCVGVGGSTRFASPDPAERAAQADELRRNLQLAHDIGAPMVRTYGGTTPAGASEDDAVDWVVAGLELALPEAERLGVKVAIETHDSFCRGATTARVLERLPHPSLGVIWDVLHPLRHGEPVEETWAHLRSRLLHVHIKDGRPDPAAARPEDWALTLLGEGVVPVPAILATLRDGGYDGMLSVEWEKKWHPELVDPEVALPQHAALLREWMAAL
jgi:sugar phosphate isomerase/epimerase